MRKLTEERIKNGIETNCSRFDLQIASPKDMGFIDIEEKASNFKVVDKSNNERIENNMEKRNSES